MKTALLGELHERNERGLVETLSAEVKKEPAGLAGEILETARIRGKQLADGRAGEARGIAREALSQGS